MIREFNSIPNFEDIWEIVKNSVVNPYRNDNYWDDYIKQYKSRKYLGEIRNKEDWSEVPREIHLRIIVIKNQKDICIRWIDPEKAGETKLLYHGHMVSKKDKGTFYSGWLKISNKGIITVH